MELAEVTSFTGVEIDLDGRNRQSNIGKPESMLVFYTKMPDLPGRNEISGRAEKAREIQSVARNAIEKHPN